MIHLKCEVEAISLDYHVNGRGDRGHKTGTIRFYVVPDTKKKSDELFSVFHNGEPVLICCRVINDIVGFMCGITGTSNLLEVGGKVCIQCDAQMISTVGVASSYEAPSAVLTDNGESLTNGFTFEIPA